MNRCSPASRRPCTSAPGTGCSAVRSWRPGPGRSRATDVGADAYAARLAEDARRFSLTRSELRTGIDRILRYVTWAIVPTATLLFVSQLRAHGSWRAAMSGAVAGTVAMVPEGLVLLTSLAFSVAVVRLAKQRVLVQELPAVEGLARVDVLCIDKTGTLTEGRLALDRIERIDEDLDPEPALAALAAADPAPNATLQAIAQGLSADGEWSVERTVPFSSARKWGAAAFVGHGAWVLGAPDILTSDPGVGARVAASAGDRRAGAAARAGGGARATGCPDSLEPGRARRPRRSGPCRRRADTAVFRRAAGPGQGAERRRAGDGRLDRRPASASKARDRRSTHGACPTTISMRSPTRWKRTASSAACPRNRSGRWSGRCRGAGTPSR